MAEQLLFHYTDKAGYDAISAQPVWHFKAAQPVDPRKEAGAYFTTKPPDDPRLFKLGIPRVKREFVFVFVDEGDLKALAGGRGQYILYAAADYLVEPDRQRWHGRTDEWTLADMTSS
jgi:hypothetical protein